MADSHLVNCFNTILTLDHGIEFYELHTTEGNPSISFDSKRIDERHFLLPRSSKNDSVLSSQNRSKTVGRSRGDNQDFHFPPIKEERAGRNISSYELSIERKRQAIKEALSQLTPQKQFLRGLLPNKGFQAKKYVPVLNPNEIDASKEIIFLTRGSFSNIDLISRQQERAWNSNNHYP